MPERQLKYPCILDLSKDCPLDCELHRMAEKVLVNLATKFGVSPEEEVEILRSGTPEQQAALRVINANALRRAGKTDKCPNRTDSEIF